MMNQEEFLQHLAPAFVCGGGGLYFEENLREALADKKVTLKSFAKEMRDDVIEQEKLGDDIKIVIGGYTISNHPKYAASFGADAAATDAGEIISLADKLVKK